MTNKNNTKPGIVFSPYIPEQTGFVLNNHLIWTADDNIFQKIWRKIKCKTVWKKEIERFNELSKRKLQTRYYKEIKTIFQ